MFRKRFVTSKAKHLSVVENAWQGLIAAVDQSGKLGCVQQIGCALGPVSPNNTEVYGVGAFLLAGSEVIKLLPFAPK